MTMMWPNQLLTSLLATAARAQDAASESATAPLVPIQDYPNNLQRSIANPEQASTVAAEIDFVFDFITWVSIVFLVAIVIVTIWFVVRYKRVDAHTIPREKPVTHNTTVELVWTIVPLALVIAMFYVGLTGYVNLRNMPPDAYEINVTAQKWSWTFQYPNGAVTSDLIIPAGEPIKLIMKSPDVLHSLFIPAFRVKLDVVPGRYTYLWFQAEEPPHGHYVYDLYCAEYCGTEHSSMITTVQVYSRDRFDEVIENEARWFEGMSLQQLQWEAFDRLYPRCTACHSVDGTDGTGPSWWVTHNDWGQQRTLADGTTVLVDENYIRDSILNPAKEISEGYANAMPSFRGQLREQEVDALIQLIKNLSDVVDETGQVRPERPVFEPVTETDEPN